MNFNSFFNILLFFIVTNVVYSQPGHTFVNLNNGIGDYIIIDSTTNLNKIEILKEKKQLRLIINLREIPTQFKNFESLERLTIQSDNLLTDLSALNYFTNLKELIIFRYSGESISFKKLKLDSLKSIRITDAFNLKNIDALTDLPLLEELTITHTPNIEKFPKFNTHNQIKTLVIDYVNDRRKKAFNNYLKNIKHLTKLESVTLGNIKGINKIPDFLPPSISYLEINGWSQEHWNGEKIEINDMSNIKLYPNLRGLKLYYVHVNCGDQQFPDTDLDNLYLNYVSTKNNISWAFTFNSITKLWLSHCFDLTTIEPKEYSDMIASIEIDHLPLQSIDFFLQLKNLNQLIIKQTPELKLTAIDAMENIPNISIFTREKYHLYKNDSIWKLVEYY